MVTKDQILVTNLSMKNQLLFKLFTPKFFKEFQSLKFEENFKNYTKDKLTHFMKVISKEVPYYRSLNIKGSDIFHFPFLTKEIIRGNFNNLKNQFYPASRFILDSTSGSTGEPIKFYHDLNLYNRRMAYAEFGDSFSGWELGEPRLIIWGAERDIKKKMSRRFAHSKFFFNTKILSSYYLTNDDLIEIIKTINSFKPVLISGYPSTLDFISNYIRSKGGLVHKPRVIVIGGETLYDSQKTLIQEVFQCKVLRRYGSREFGVIASECQEQQGLHIHSDRIFLEILNEKLEQTQAGELGEIIITDLENYVFPFVRYRIGDIGILSDDNCKCGRKSPLLKSIEGRTFDLIVGTNGNRVPGNFFTLLRNKIKGLIKFQVVQKKYGSIHFNAVVNELFNLEEKNKLILELKSKLGNDTMIEINVCNDIDLTDSGKFRFVISEVNPFKNVLKTK